MLKHGVFVIGFSFPVVPKGKARIRVQVFMFYSLIFRIFPNTVKISAAHSFADIDHAVEAFIAVGRTKGVIPASKL